MGKDKNRAFDHRHYTDWRRPEELVPYEKNAKIHDEKQIRNLVTSLKRFGWQQDCVVTSDNVLVIGHGRRLAAMQIGCEIPVHVIDKKAEDLTDEDIRELRIADNQTNAETGFDFELLAEDLEGLDFDGFDFDFQLPEIPEEPVIVSEDDWDKPLPEEPVSRPGQIWQLGRHRLMCGDSTNIGDIDKLIRGETVDMIYTDPPYGMNLDTDYSSMKNHLDFAQDKGFVCGKKYDAGIVDDFCPEMIDSVFAIQADEVFLWGADYYAELLPDRNNGAWIVWDKRANGNDDINEDYDSDKMYGSCFELCWSKKKHKRDIARVKWAGVFGVEQEPEKRRFHPTQKPVGLSAWFIRRYSKAGNMVLDLFGGSGSTLIACEQLGRKCRMMELDPKYADVIIARWETFTGEKAVLLDG